MEAMRDMGLDVKDISSESDFFSKSESLSESREIKISKKNTPKSSESAKSYSLKPSTMIKSENYEKFVDLTTKNIMVPLKPHEFVNPLSAFVGGALLEVGSKKIIEPSQKFREDNINPFENVDKKYNEKFHRRDKSPVA